MSNRFIRIQQVLDQVGFKRSHLYDLINRDRFPAPYHIGPRLSVWSTIEVDEWISEQMNQGG